MSNELTAPSNLRREIARHIVPGFRSTWVAEKVFDRSLDWSLAIGGLRELNLSSALKAAARINAASAEFSEIADTTSLAAQRKIVALIQFLFPSEFQARAWCIAKSARNFHPLAPQAGIAFTECCLRFCKHSGGLKFDWPQSNRWFSELLLSFQSNLLRGDLIGPKTDFANLSELEFRSLTRNYMSANYEAPWMLLLRHFLMFERPLQTAGFFDRTTTTADVWFKAMSDIDPAVYRTLAIAMRMIGSGFTISRPRLRGLVDHLPSSLVVLKTDVAAIFERMHREAVFRPEEILPKDDPVDWESAVYSQHYLRRRPLYPLEGGLTLCLHRQLLIEKFFGSTVHVLTDMVRERCPAGWPEDLSKRISKLRTYYGYAFEDYLRVVVTALFEDPKTIFRFSYSVEKDSPERDALVIHDETAIVLEFVNHPWSLAERSSGASESFIKHLSDNIKKTADVAGRLNSGDKVAGIEVPLKRIIPVVIMSEALPINEAIALTLRRDLVKHCGEKEVDGYGKVLPMQTLSITQLENFDRQFRRPKGAKEVADFLAKRALLHLSRFCGEPYLSENMGGIDRFQWALTEADAAFKKLGPSLFK